MKFVELMEEISYKQKSSSMPKNNLFKVLGIENMEIKHSNFLAYLFNANFNENIGNLILFDFLKKFQINKILKTPIKEILDHSTISIFREYKNTDIIVDIAPFCTIVIENKIWSAEHKGQLFDYYLAIHQELNDLNGKFCKNTYKEPICIFLTPEGRQSQDSNNSNWIPISYFETYSILLNFQNKHSQRLTDKQKILLEDYVNLLKENIVKLENDKKEILDNYYSNKEYKNIMEQIIEIVPNYKERGKIIKEECKKNNIAIINDTEKSTAYINILPQSFKNIFKDIGVGENFFFFQIINNQSFKTSSVLTYFDFSSKDNALNLKTAKTFFEFLTPNKTLKKDTSKDRALGYSFVYLTQKDEYSMAEEEKQKIIKEYFANFENKKEVQYLYNKLLEFRNKYN